MIELKKIGMKGYIIGIIDPEVDINHNANILAVTLEDLIELERLIHLERGYEKSS